MSFSFFGEPKFKRDGESSNSCFVFSDFIPRDGGYEWCSKSIAAVPQGSVAATVLDRAR
jgi:hypothetical protein